MKAMAPEGSAGGSDQELPGCDQCGWLPHRKVPKTYAAMTGLQNAQEKVSNSLHAEKYRPKEDSQQSDSSSSASAKRTRCY